MEPQKSDISYGPGGALVGKDQHSLLKQLPNVTKVSISETAEPRFDPETGLATISPLHHQEYQAKGQDSDVYKSLKKQSGSAIFKQKIENIAKEEGVHPEHLFDSLRKAGFKRILNRTHEGETKWSKNGEALHIDTPEGIRQFIKHHKTNIQDTPWQKDRQAFAEAKAALSKTSDQMDGSTDGKMMDPHADNKRKFVDGLGSVINNRKVYDHELFKSLGATTNGRLKRIIQFFQQKSKNKGDIRKEFKALTSGNEREILNLLAQVAKHHGFDDTHTAELVTKKPKATPEELKKTASKVATNAATRENNYGLMA